MRNFKRLLIVIIALALAASVVVFVLENRVLTQLVFFGWTSPELPTALYVMGAFVLGLIIGPVMSWWPHQRLRIRYHKQAKQLKIHEQRIIEQQAAKAAQKAAATVEQDKIKQVKTL